MAQRVIFYTSDAEGMTIGVVGDTYMECLLALSEEFGEGVLPLYEKTREELEQTAAAVAEAFADELDGAMADIASASTRKAPATTIPEDTRSQREKVKDALDSLPSEGADGGGEQQSLPPARPDGGDEDDAPLDVGSDDAPICSICGADTTPDFAELTKLEHGEIRCPACIP